MADLDLILNRVRAYEPKLVELPPGDIFQAAVAIILHEPEGGHPEILFIERAIKQGDPWSGQMAFPGGKLDPADHDLEVTAIRETSEEVGVELGKPVGRLDDVHGSRSSREHLRVAPFVFHAEKRPRITINPEVAATVWIPVHWMLNPSSRVQYTFDHDQYPGTYSAFQFDRFTVWGLTHRILSNFVNLLDRRFPT